jgi:hypothetical protein
LNSATIIRGVDDFFCTDTPNCFTGSGSRGMARFTLFCTCTCAMSGFVVRVKNTVMVTWPVLELVDVMYMKLSTPLICASMGAATESPTVFASAPG